MWKNNNPTSQEIDRLAKEWLHRKPPMGIRKDVLIPFEKRAEKRDKAEVTFDKFVAGLQELKRLKKYRPMASTALSIISYFS